MATGGQLPLFPRNRRARHRSGLGPRGAAQGRPLPVVGRIPHRRRSEIDGHFPVHVTLRLRDGLPNLRRRDLYAMLRVAFRQGRDRFHFRLTAYTVQHHHLHLLCEAPTAAALGHGLQGLCIRVAKGVNHARGAHGTVFRERYYAHELRTLTETRRALRYVAANDWKHGNANGDYVGRMDPCSSFYFWRPNRLFAGEEAPVMAALTAHLRAALRLELGLRGPPPLPAPAPG